MWHDSCFCSNPFSKEIGLSHAMASFHLKENDSILYKGGTHSGDGTEAPDSVSIPEIAPDEEELLPIKIGSMTFYPRENGRKHQTSKFELVERGTPIFRRGQNFYIALMYAGGNDARKFDPETDQIKLIFRFGPHPSPMNGTEQIVKAEKVLNADESRWSARIRGFDQNAVTLEASFFCRVLKTFVRVPFPILLQTKTIFHLVPY